MSSVIWMVDKLRHILLFIYFLGKVGFRYEEDVDVIYIQEDSYILFMTGKAVGIPFGNSSIDKIYWDRSLGSWNLLHHLQFYYLCM